jgi:uncharacterized damage-inducible protein DinB
MPYGLGEARSTDVGTGRVLECCALRDKAAEIGNYNRTMTVTSLRVQFDYGYWANAKLFNLVSLLTTEQFIQPVSGSHGSIRNTLVHMMSTEWGWLERAGGARRGAKLSGVDFPTHASVVEKWAEIERNVRRFLDGLGDKELERIIAFAIGDGPKRTLSIGEMLHHAAIHGVHHRGQVALLLRSLGYVPGDFDMFFYYSHLRGD